jgi:hypothetical protein
VCKGLPAGGSLSDEEFAAFLDACRAEAVAKQEAFQRRLAGSSRWSYDMDRGTLQVGELGFGMTPIGTFSAERCSWLWAWANEDFPAAARQAAAPIQSLREVTGFAVFALPGIGASAVDAQDFVAFGVHALEATGFFRCPREGGPTLYLAVHEATG